MTIYYCLVANKHCPLAEYSNGGDKKMSEIAQKLLKKLTFEEDTVESVDCDGTTYSYRVEDEVVYVCVTEETFGKTSAQLFLRYIHQQFDNEFGIRGKATKLKLDMNRDFAPTLKKHMEQFSADGGQAKLQALKKDLDSVKESMQQNISKVLERGDKIELLVDKSDQLNSQSAAFAQSSRNLRRHLWWQNVKMMLAIGTLCVLFLILIVTYIKRKAT
ncbi:TPA: hypothetical protein N0F65_001298 [Lagenidium giganteum]|uniref:Vesicle-associated membrane protein n=1 Tax=Lagenidium giganteum TaxID=4803 RepID=A0AAV2Z244_9STRA|nr:TPA: hypothetical protein N0F65_001298 [Lagenidium giganteum]